MCAHNNEQNFEQKSETLRGGTENSEVKYQYILDEDGNLTEIPKDKCLPVEHPIKVKLQSAFEVFVRVPGTENYWISNYGRLVNNLNRKDKSTFYHHKTGYCHYTVFEIDRFGERWEHEYYTDELVAKIFLKPQPIAPFYRGNIWHKDGDKHNNYYKNLIYVSAEEKMLLRSGAITWQDLDYKQEFFEYENRASTAAYIAYNKIKARCKNTTATKNIHACYNDVVMCEEWLNNPKSFIKWYLTHYYACDGEVMAVDKDLFGSGLKLYSPQTCCVLPQGLNTLLSNNKKHYYDSQRNTNLLPYGVSYSSKRGKYYGTIQFSGTDKKIQLSDWNTPEEAFEEYKQMKRADLYTVAAKYKDKIPDYIYKKLLTVEVQPY